MTANTSPENVARIVGLPDYAEGDCESVKDALICALAAERDRAIQDAIDNAEYVDLVLQYRAERDALAARLEKVEAERDERKRYAVEMELYANEARDNLAAAEARVANLLEALAEAANRLAWCSGFLPYEENRNRASKWADEARAALQETKT
jgi:hypothetical protein